MANPPKKLYRSRSDRMLAGVCGGLGEYLNIDSTLVRLITVLLTIWFPFLVFAYFILFIVVPREPEVQEEKLIETEPETESSS